MRLPEQRFWDRTRRNLGVKILAKRIENLVEDGMPDVITLASDTGRVVFVELKAITGLPARPTTRILKESHQRLTQDQINWQLNWRQWGGSAATLIGIGGDRQILVQADYVDNVNHITTLDLQRAHPFLDTWDGIRKFLIEGK